MTAYANVTELRKRINKTATSDDGVLLSLINAATAAIDRLTNHAIQGVDVFYPSGSSARVYAGSGARWQWIDECVAITSVGVKTSTDAATYTAWGAADWLAFTGSVLDPDFNTLPYTGLLCAPNGDYGLFTSGAMGSSEYYFNSGLAYAPTRRHAQFPTVQVTATWGVTVTPPDEIREACVMLAARWWKRLESAMSDTLASGELGQLLYTQPVDPDVKLLLMNTRWYRPQVGPRY